MALVISDSSMIEKRYIKLTDDGVVWYESAFIGGKKRVRFNEIDYVLMSDAHVLTIARGTDQYSIRTKPHKPKHRQLVDTLLHRLRESDPPSVR